MPIYPLKKQKDGDWLILDKRNEKAFLAKKECTQINGYNFTFH